MTRWISFARRIVRRGSIVGVVLAASGATVLACNGIAGIEEPRRRDARDLRRDERCDPCDPEESCEDGSVCAATGVGGAGGGAAASSTGASAESSSATTTATTSSAESSTSSGGAVDPPACAVSVPDGFSSPGLTVQNFSLNGGGNTVVVAPGSTVTASFDALVSDCICAFCTDQVQVGLVPGEVQYCAVFGVAGCQGLTGTVVNYLVAPTMPGTYGVRVDQSIGGACSLDFAGTTAPDAYVGVLCVQ